MQKITLEQVENLQRAYGIGRSIPAIALQESLSYGTVYRYTRALERGFGRPSDYDRTCAYRKRKAPLNQAWSTLLRDHLKQLGQTHEWLCQQLGVDVSSIGRYLNGTTVPSRTIRPRILAALNIPRSSIEDLLVDTNPNTYR
ncbi:MAG: helix-turn-helix transcriptional regulator [Nanoarchaeota archaeon]